METRLKSYGNLIEVRPCIKSEKSTNVWFSMKKALITGITGQDGSYLAEFLLEKGYEVHGIVRRSSLFNRSRIEALYFKRNSQFKNRLFLHYGDLGDSSSLFHIVNRTRPDEIYNLGAQSHVGISFEIPEYTADVTGVGVVRLLEAIRQAGIETKFYQASSSELYGKVLETPQTETTPFNPRSPYACAKAYGFYITKNYRESYDMFACNGILFNHESPRRGENFVTRKITLSLARVKLGFQNKVSLGNLEARRDWGYAGDYVEAMWMMLQHARPDDYVVATNETHSVREFVEAACERLEFDIEWQGAGVDEKGFDAKTGEVIVDVNPRFFRPAEVELLKGDYAKAKATFNWEPRTTFAGLVSMMVDADLEYVKQSNGIK